MFLQDGRAVERAVSVAEKHKPDAIELLPGVAAVEAAEAFARLAVPRLAGGLIHSEAVVRRILDSGCRAISTSDRNLWRLNEAW
jgi:glycerol uptake operon antiterminator